MNRLTYVGGFNNGPPDDKLLDALMASFNVEDVDWFTFARAMTDTSRVEKASRKSLVVTHSAGMLAIRAADPEETHAFNPPLPTSVPRLLARTATKTTGMYIRGASDHRLDGVAAASRYSRRTTAEALRHPIGNLRHLGSVAAFDAFEQASIINNRGDGEARQVVLSWTEHDDYYRPSEQDMNKAETKGIKTLILPGEHDELVLRPDNHLENYLTHLG